uniref:Uncharacterized protein n=1 Tax=Monopterus albus TaxID=43700 RepID=A0A3Q3J756_MONAL
MSGSMSSRGPEAALFRRPTSSSNSEANTDEGRLMVDACSDTQESLESRCFCSRTPHKACNIRELPDVSFRCCR